MILCCSSVFFVIDTLYLSHSISPLCGALQALLFIILLTHWGQVMHICKLTIIGSDNSLSPGWCQAIIWTNDGILLSGPLETNFSEILIEIYKFSFKKMHLKMSCGKWRPSCLGLNVLKKNLTSYLLIGAFALITLLISFIEKVLSVCEAWRAIRR